MNYDDWKSTTPEDEEHEASERERKENARMERMIDNLESGYDPKEDTI